MRIVKNVPKGTKTARNFDVGRCIVPRKKIEWTAREIGQFKELCGLFCTEDEVCRVMGVTAEQLGRLINKHLREEVCGKASQRITFDEAFERFSAKARMDLRRKQLKLAMEGDRSMLVWLGKQYLGQRDPGRDKADGAPAQGAERPSATLIVKPPIQSFRERSPVARAAAK